VTRTVVVDASVAAKWLIHEEGTGAALRLEDPAWELACPDLLFLEVGNVVWRKVQSGEVDEEAGRRMVAAILDAPLQVEPSAALLPAAWEIAVRHDRTVYDGVYLALAVALDAPLVTADRRLVRGLESADFRGRILDVEDLPG
jgi:predicted nucleic acid-binding protein